MSKWSFGHQIRLDSQNPSTDPHRKLDRRRFESIWLYPMNHAKKATPHLKMKETASKKPKNSSASLDLARLAIPMDYSIVWLGRGSTGEQWPIPMYLRAYTTKQTPKSAEYCGNNAYSVHGVNPHGLLKLGTVSIQAKRISGPQKHANGE